MSLRHPEFLALVALPLAVAASILLAARARARWRDAFARGRAAWSASALPASALRAVGAALVLAVAAMGPTLGVGWVDVPSRGLDVIIVLDASRSMRARDLQPSRLARALAEIDALCDARGAWRLGLVRFRGEAERVAPLTYDAASVAAFARETDPDVVPGAGSGLARGIEVAVGAFDADPRIRRVLLVLTDADVESTPDLDAAAALARARAVTILGLQCGTIAGAVVPVDAGATAAPIVDAGGALVVSRAQPAVLNALAATTAGRTFDLAREPFAMNRVIDEELRPRLPAPTGLALERRPLDRSSWLVGVALLLLVPWWRVRVRLDRWRAVAIIALVCVVPLMLAADDVDALVRRANAAFARGAPADAKSALESLASARPYDAQVAYDLGFALLRGDDAERARVEFERASELAAGSDRARALHGAALATLRLADAEEAAGGARLRRAEALLDAARGALVQSVLAGDSDAARSNLDVASFRLERVRAELARDAQSGGQNPSPGANPNDGTPPSDGKPTPGGGASASSNSTGGASGPERAPGTRPETGAGAGTPDATSERLPGGMFKAEANRVLDVVRRFEQERRALDRERALRGASNVEHDW